MLKRPAYLVLRGGLGNQLFMFASMYAFAKSNQRNLQLVTHWFQTPQRDKKFEMHKREFELSQLPSAVVFRRRSTILLDRFLYTIFLASIKFPLIQRLGIVVDVDREENLSGRSLGLINYGYMQKPENFNSMRSEILKLFAFDPESEEDIQKRLDKRHEKTRKIAVHVRRGDNLLTESQSNVLSQTYYSNCLRRLEADHCDVFFFSDDTEWCKANFDAENHFVVEEANPLITIKLMAQCDDFILSPSTFSWWGAWLSEAGDKRVIYPEPYNQESPKIWSSLPQKTWISETALYQR